MSQTPPPRGLSTRSAADQREVRNKLRREKRRQETDRIGLVVADECRRGGGGEKDTEMWEISGWEKKKIRINTRRR